MNKNKSRKELFEEYEKNYLERLENPTIENKKTIDEKNESEITDEEDEYEKSIFDYSKHLVIVFYLTYALFGLLLLFGPKITFLGEFIQNYTEYYEPIQRSIPIIVGLIAVISAFYLGKFRDYKRDYIKQEGSHYEIQEKIIRTYGSIERSFNTELITTNNTIKECIDDIDNDYGTFTKKMVNATIWIVVFFITTFVVISTSIQNQNDFLFIFLSIIFSSSIFIFLWLYYEKKISDFEIDLENLTLWIAALKGIYETQMENLEK